MGYLLEIHFIKMGEMVLSQPKPAQIKVEVKKNGLSQQRGILKKNATNKQANEE